MNILVTGGAGFIGSAVVRRLLRAGGANVLVVDKLTYAGNRDSLKPVENAPGFAFMQADIADAAAMRAAFERAQPDIVMHLAAESHVDRSIDAPGTFVQTNLVGTYCLLEAARAWHAGLNGEARARFRFHHISTDEVFGALGPDGRFSEETAYAPRSPYAASKAGSDHLVRAWGETFGLPVISLVDTPGFMVGPDHEQTALVRHTSRLLVAGAALTVPLISVVIRRAYGLGAQAMVGGSLWEPLLTVAWPSAHLGPMGLEGAVRLAMRKDLEAIDDEEERERRVRELTAMAEQNARAMNAAQLFEIDDVIDPAETRKVIASTLEAAPERIAEPPAHRFVDTW